MKKKIVITMEEKTTKLWDLFVKSADYQIFLKVPNDNDWLKSDSLDDDEFDKKIRDHAALLQNIVIFLGGFHPDKSYDGKPITVWQELSLFMNEGKDLFNNAKIDGKDFLSKEAWPTEHNDTMMFKLRARLALMRTAVEICSSWI